jgi:EAL domain-containing protein (putative c-di-GMP-specific phosphodiesterase class I)
MPGTRVRALPDCRPLLADPDDLTLAFQPIVDLAGATVAGYEALARFPGTAGPDVWFAAAADAGLSAELAALALGKALAAVDGLPGSTFLTVGVSPHLLGTGPVRDALATRRDLRRVVVALTGPTPVDDLAVLRRQCGQLRDRGAQLALDDGGAGYSGLQRMAALRPQIVPLGRALVSATDTDPVRAALTDTVGGFVGRIDARLLATDLGTAAELAAVVRLGVPLGQGSVLGRPASGFAPLAPEVVRLVRSQVARARRTETVAGLLRPVWQVEAHDDVPAPPPAVLTGSSGEPLGLLLRDPRTAQTYLAPVSLRVQPSADIGQTLQRALSRPPAQRFDPVLCTDRAGTVLGLLRIEDLASARHAR